MVFFNIMEVRLVGGIGNVGQALAEVRNVRPDAPRTENRGELISPEMLEFLVGLLRADDTRYLFLKLMTATLDVTAPEEWWHQGEAYFGRLEWVRRHPTGEENRSLLSQSDFEGGIPSMLLDTLNEHIAAGQRELLAATMPENFLRRAYVITNYAELRLLYQERGHYNSGHWRDLASFIDTLPYSELLTVRAEGLPSTGANTML